MKPILFLIWFTLSPFLLLGQPGFSKVYQLEPSHANDMNSLVIDNDTIVLFQAAFDTTVNQWGLRLVKIDSFGNVLFTSFLSDSTTNYTRSLGGNDMIKTSDGGYAFAANYSMDADTIFLAKYNHAGEKEFVRYYAPPVSNTDFFACRTLHQLSDGGFFLMTYYSLETTNYFSLSLLRVDASGEELWRRNYVAQDTVFVVHNLVEINKNHFVISGSIGSPPNIPNIDSWNRPYILGIDSLGNKIQYWEGVDDAVILGFIVAPDGGYLYSTLKVFRFANYTKVRPGLVKIDTLFNEQWNYYVDQPLSVTAHYANIVRTPDGHYVASGAGGYPYSERPGIHTKITEEGEVLWERLDRAAYNGVKGTRNRFHSTGVLSSGSIISCGSTWITEPNGYSEKGWLVKLSPGGCMDDTDTLDCWVGATVVDIKKPPPSQEIQVYPNPVGDELTIQLTGDLHQKSYIYFYDVTGRFLRKQRLDSAYNVLTISDLPKGMIFYTINSTEGVLRHGKLVVDR